MITRYVTAAIVLGCLLAVGSAGAAPSVTVSPGAEDRLAEIEGRCPTFIWGAEEGAVAHEIVVYRILDESALADLSFVNLESCEEVLYRRVPGGATAWQPELAEALIPGAAYVWFVRAVFDEGDGGLTEAGAWTDARFFSVTAAVTERQLEEALGLVRRYLEQNPGQEARLGTHSAERAEKAADRPSRDRNAGTASAGTKSVPTATAAVKGSSPDPTGEVYGVVGLSASPDGAGVAAANSGGGPDLVLDGSEDGVADTELSESGIDRPSAAAQTFNIGNSGGGGMSLQVDGAGVLTTASAIDADTLDGIDGADYATDTEAAGMVAVHAVSADHDGRYFTQTELGAPGAAAVHWDNLSSVPAGFADGVDNDTTYAIGNGLILENGEITIDPRLFPTEISTPDSEGEAGFYTSIAIGADGNALISYWDMTNHNLKVAHCDGAACTSSTTATLDDGSQVGSHSSIAIGTDGLGIISYCDHNNGDLEVAHCDDTACSSAYLDTLDSMDDVGYYTSIVIGSDGLPLISYFDQSNQNLKVAHCETTYCTGATVSVLDSVGDVGRHTSITVGTDGLGLISYADWSYGNLKVAKCNDIPCTTATISVVDTSGFSGFGSSISIGADGLGIISYFDYFAHDLKAAHCNDSACTTATVTTLDSTGDLNFGHGSSITIGDDGLPLISYYDHSSSSLKVARCRTQSCSTGADFSTIIGHGAGRYSSIAISTSGRGLISFLGDNHLKVAHLGVGVP